MFKIYEHNNVNLNKQEWFVELGLAELSGAQMEPYYYAIPCLHHASPIPFMGYMVLDDERNIYLINCDWDGFVHLVSDLTLSRDMILLILESMKKAGDYGYEQGYKGGKQAAKAELRSWFDAD